MAHLYVNGQLKRLFECPVRVEDKILMSVDVIWHINWLGISITNRPPDQINAVLRRDVHVHVIRSCSCRTHTTVLWIFYFMYKCK